MSSVSLIGRWLTLIIKATGTNIFYIFVPFCFSEMFVLHILRAMAGFMFVTMETVTLSN